MADFTVLADTSVALLRLLRASLCPEIVQSPESIVMIAPTDKNGDFQLGLHLYDFRELSEYRSTTPINTVHNTRRRPPMPLTLHYLLFLNTKAQIAAGAEIEQRIFGRVLQALSDRSRLDLSDANPQLEAEEAADISLLHYTFEEKTKIWSAMQVPLQNAVYFSVSPVLLAFRKETPFVRITETQLHTNVSEGRP